MKKSIILSNETIGKMSRKKQSPSRIHFSIHSYNYSCNQFLIVSSLLVSIALSVIKEADESSFAH